MDGSNVYVGFPNLSSFVSKIHHIWVRNERTYFLVETEKIISQCHFHQYFKYVVNQCY